ncbi:MAG: bifunctional UDP-N-acetylglucosamine diphosphorylase/glucosamine-1-phosphate N-acetyltransferase GlmU [Pseudomonadales bacterium]|nr:bifunctional UDP-N-acetylglucosamine diphosphorylase/glucosamine-1-phosphate N-acetyltransferase GlmU [Pseudomonadales bacterium]
MNLNVVILAAGKGSRMKSKLPKVLQPLAKKPLLSHVLDTSFNVSATKVIVVYGHGGDLVQSTIKASYPEAPIVWVEQKEQLGTGHAVQQALSELEPGSKTLILYGDVPLVSKESLETFIEDTEETGCGVLTVKLDNPKGYGRILRDESYHVTSIVEEKDATDAEKLVQEVNTGIMLVNSDLLTEWLPTLKNENAQGEYYLTDIIKIAREAHINVNATVISDPMEVEGVNDKRQLAALERQYQRSLADQLMVAGATLIDPNRIDVRGSLSVSADCFIDVNCVFEGQVSLGENVQIGPNCLLINSTIGDNTVIKANTVIEDANISDSCDIGPYARIRPGTEMKSGAKVGNFVETKKSVIGEGSKVNHLTYVGDAELGKDVNVGAGTITCNYDGVNKSKTIIGDGAFIGSNSSLVAPVEIGAGATIGAGSTISKDAEAEKLTLTRAKQMTVAGWKRPTKK